MAIRILLADDHQIVRDGLRRLIETAPDLEVVGEAPDGRTAIRLARRLRPDVAVLDVTMPGLNGMEATRLLAKESPATRVVALTMHDDRRFVAAMFDAGARGYLLKDCAFEELVTAIRGVAAGATYVSEGVTRPVGVPADGGAKGPRPKLSVREREVLQLLAEGRSTKRIAMELNLSAKTIETHRRNIGIKLGVDSVAEMTKYAIREGLTSL